MCIVWKQLCVIIFDTSPKAKITNKENIGVGVFFGKKDANKTKQTNLGLVS